MPGRIIPDQHPHPDLLPLHLGTRPVQKIRGHGADGSPPPQSAAASAVAWWRPVPATPHSRRGLSAHFWAGAIHRHGVARCRPHTH
jgi:hypothetical protein